MSPPPASWPPTASAWKATKWLLLSAEQGNAWAQYDLGVLFAIREDFAEAAAWLRRSVVQEFEDAEIVLVRLYKEGKIVPLDVGESQRWNEVAEAEAQRSEETAEIRQMLIGLSIPGRRRPVIDLTIALQKELNKLQGKPNNLP